MRDTHELVELLEQRFARPRSLLFGLSWGTLLAARETAAHPDSVTAVVCAGQLAHWGKNEGASYEKVLRDAHAAGNAKAVAQLEAIGAPVNGRYRGGAVSLRRQRGWLTRSGGRAAPEGCSRSASHGT